MSGIVTVAVQAEGMTCSEVRENAWKERRNRASSSNFELAEESASIAHHEPIFNRQLIQDYRSILEVAGWICPDTAAWIRHHSRVEDLLARDWKDDGIVFWMRATL